MSEVRLQRFLARAGIASRRKCEQLILDGLVSVNGSVVSELGSKVDPFSDVIEFDGRVVSLPSDTTVIMLNKPKGYVTTMSDAHGRKCVSELVSASEYPGLYPVGRLDMDTTGLLLFTNDGELGHRLLHPSTHVDKRYIANISGILTEDERRQLESGLLLEDGITAPAKCEVLRKGRGNSTVALTVHEGRKRQVRRMLKAVGHEVLDLHRESFGPLDLGDLPIGKWRMLTEDEVASINV